MEIRNRALVRIYLRYKTEEEIKDANLWLDQAKDEHDWVLRLILLIHPVSSGLYEAKEEYRKVEQSPDKAYEDIKERASMHLEKMHLDRKSAGIIPPITYASHRNSRYGYLTELSLALELTYGCSPQSARGDAASTGQE